MKRLILCDMDGTLANNEQRAHLLPAKDDCNSTDKWEAFNQACDKDEPIEAGFCMMMELSLIPSSTAWALWSGRSESVLQKSCVWFDTHASKIYAGLNYYWSFNQGKTAFFRSQDDHRPAAICKADLVEQAVQIAQLTVEDELVLIDDDLSVLQECKARFPYAICVWMGGSHCKALANGVTTK